MDGRRTALVMDVPGSEGRRLAETVVGAGFEARAVTSLEELRDAHLAERAPIAIVAYEGLFPVPERSLRFLRAECPRLCIVVVFAEGSPRLRLGERLWAMRLLDYLVPRSSPPHVLTPLLRQAYADSLLEETLREEQTPAGISQDRYTGLRHISRLGAALTSQRSMVGLLRELFAKLGALVSHDVLEVLLTVSPSREVFVFQTEPVDHEAIWSIAEGACRAARPFMEEELAVGELVFVEGNPLPVGDRPAAETDAPRTVIHLPMNVCGELMGCMSVRLLASEAASHDARFVLQLVSQHLGAAIHCVRDLEASEQASLVDELTGANNRRYLRRVLEDEWGRAVRYNMEISLAILDLDHFKEINDAHGHLAGDQVLKTVAHEINENLRDTDHFVRYGGEEFVVVLPQTGAANAARVIDRMRMLVANRPLLVAGAPNLEVTFSAGVACFPNIDVNSAEELLARADEALLAAKREGRNQIRIASPTVHLSMGDLPANESLLENRRHRRVKLAESAKVMSLPELEASAVDATVVDISDGGIKVDGLRQPMEKDTYALVYFAGTRHPRLSRVVWSSAWDGTAKAGLRFVSDSDLTQGKPAARSKALLVTKHSMIRDVAKRVLKATRYEATFLEGDETFDLDRVGEYSLFMIGESALRGEFGRKLKQARPKLNPALRIVLLNEEDSRQDVLQTIWQERIEHVIGRDANQEEALFATLSKLLLGSYFGIRKYLLWGASIKSTQLGDAADKQHVFDSIRRLAGSVSCHPRVTDLLIAAVDEMIINAFYAEPDPQRRRAITIEYGSDARLLAVAVIDSYGRFAPDAMYEAIGHALEQEKNGMALEAEHGHLGFRTMLSSLSQLVINVEPDKRTEMIGIVDLRKSLREYRMAAPSLGLFSPNSGRTRQA
jgi:diguanylate cyclase (GGDEF)-like protein